MAWFKTVATKMPHTIGQGFFKPRRQQQRQQLRLVANFGQREDTG